MYSIDDKSEAIKEVQGFLDIFESGYYDELTRKSVAEFQSDNEIEITGIVDLETYTLLREHSSLRKSEEKALLALHTMGDFPYKHGDFGDDVTLIHSLIKTMSNEYTLESSLPSGRFYGQDTSLIVLELREIFGLEGSGEVDHILYNRMIDEKNIFLLKERMRENNSPKRE